MDWGIGFDAFKLGPPRGSQAPAGCRSHDRFLDRLSFALYEPRRRAHCALQCRGAQQDWSAFVAMFAADAILGFVGVAAGPFAAATPLRRRMRTNHPMTL